MKCNDKSGEACNGAYNDALERLFVFLGKFLKGMIAMENVEKQRIIQEYVPGKQVTLAHIIAKPQKSIYLKLGLADEFSDAIGILTITPSEAVIIAADVATKAANVEIGFIDRFSGSLVVTGDVSSIESALTEILNILTNVLSFTPTTVTKS